MKLGLFERATIALAVVACVTAGCDRLIERQIELNVTRAEVSLLKSPDLHVVLCGTGSPLPDATRAGACTAVIAAGELVLVDVGPGSWEVVDLANLPTSGLSAILLTHFHSDHIGDLGEAFTQSWIAGRDRPLDIYGPPGTARVVDGFRAAYSFDIDHRVIHHGENNLPRAAAGAVARELAIPDGDGATLVFERKGLRVTMFRVNHEPVEPAVGYRFDYRGRSVVISGDTRKSQNLARYAKDADLLVHEALQPDLIRRAAAVTHRLGRDRQSKMATDVLSYHTSPVEAAELARDAGVAHLVFTHVVPGPTNFLARRLFLAGVADAFHGQVTLGQDGMRFALPPKE